MNKLVSLALASASVAAFASTASAQSPEAPAAATRAEQATLGEIVVTARRRAESLQEVPQTVSAVTSDTLQKLNIQQFQDVQAVVPGLSLYANSTGYGAAASLRGVTFNVNTGAQPTVALYLNDAPAVANSLFRSLFDVGQIEVLKGPQGTNRGVSAPSGAITLTTRKPDLSRFGAYADVTVTDLHGRNAQGAVNIPIVEDVLALRIAGVIDASDYDGVRSLHNNLRPRSVTTAERFSVSFEPSDVFNAHIMYQNMDQEQTSFQQVSGPGSGGFTLGSTSFPASVNPPLSPTQRISVQDGPNQLNIHFDTVTAQINSRIFGQHLSYVGSYQHQTLHTVAEGAGNAVGDVGNVLPGIALYGDTYNRNEVTTHEIRLASDPSPDRFFDYTVGAYYRWEHPAGPVSFPGPLMPGAFGSPASGVDLGAFNPAYQIPLLIDVNSTFQETSLFGTLTLHLGENTELSGGLRHIWSIVNNQTKLSLGSGLIALPPAFVGAPSCAAFQLPSTYPGFCDVPLPGGTVVNDFANRTSEAPTIYNVSLSHHVTRDLLVYANTGTSYRPPVASVGISGALAANPDPALRTLTFHPSEKSRAYEIGIKSTWLDGRARLNASIFRQKFRNLTIFIPGVTYANTVSTPAQDTNFNFTASVDALVQGFDIDAAFQVTPNWNVSAQVSYADGKVKGSQVPCNVTDAAGRPVYNTLGLISLCPGGSASRLPFWNASLQTEYTRPVANDVDGFVRLLATYYPENKNRAEANFTVDNYSLVNLFAGVRSHDGAWEASIFARNAFNTQRALDVESVQTNLNTALGATFPQLFHPTGYAQTLQTPRREMGINIKYAWGSR